MLRTHTCGELETSKVGVKVTLCGWVDRFRDLGQLVFVTLRDRYGTTQCVLEGSLDQTLHLEDCLSIEGTVRKREEKDINESMLTGAIEVVIDKMTVLNTCKVLPFAVKDQVQASDDLRLTYRYLDLRRPHMQKHLLIRHKVIQATRTALANMGFLEIETPLFVRSTPEGARDFVVPSRVHAGKFYALPQSPQLYKQLLMISGCDRYFQFAPAFRDEDLRADRVPVHTQIDMEMSFVDERDVFLAVETYMTQVFEDVLGLKLQAPFLIMSYAEAMERFGCDKPDMRFGLEIQDFTKHLEPLHIPFFADVTSQSIRGIKVTQIEHGEKVSRKDLDHFEEQAKAAGLKGLSWVRKKDGVLSGNLSKFLPKDFLDLKDGDLLILAYGPYGKTSKVLSQIRLQLGKSLQLIPEGRFDFLWVKDFPLFEWDEERQSYQAMHHLFTHPKVEDMEYLETDPGKVRGQLYDLVLNGVELCSGSIRIHRPELQKKILDIVQMPEEEAMSKFGFLMNAFSYGAPPHGGSAVGLDRLVALLCQVSSIKEVIAFPCNHQGIFPLDGSPAPLSPEQLDELKLSVRPFHPS